MTQTLIRADQWPPTEGFRPMLPSGFHCQTCHGLVRVYEAHAGMTGRDFVAVFDAEVVAALLAAHRALVCRGGAAL